MKGLLTTTVIFLVAVAALLSSQRKLELLTIKQSKFRKDSTEVLYLPSGRGLHFMSFGYQNALSGMIWLNTVSYFGKHYASDQQYEWLDHMCNLVTMLNPRVYEPYYFCSTMLAWETHQAGRAVAILSKGKAAHPQDWFLPYLRGFYQLYFLKDPEAAKKDFVYASQQPDAHPLTIRLAAKTISQLEDPETAISFLKTMIRNSTDELQRAPLQRKLDELLSKRLIQSSQQSSSTFKEGDIKRETVETTISNSKGSER